MRTFPPPCLALAHDWRWLIQSGAVRDQVDLARLVGVSRARATQVMNLLWLVPDLQEKVLGGFESPTERRIRQAAQHQEWRA